MVAKINRGVSLYGAIVYNQQKVDDATARIIYGNRMITDVTGNPEQAVRQTMWAFENYLLANKNTEKPVLHISLNPSLDDRLTDSQFADLAKEYMQKMGYGDQPYIVYVHEDIGRRHIHIVSTCVNEKGEKIDDAYEWNRSMKACRELERKMIRENRYAHPSSLPLSVNATVTKGWKNVSVTTPASIKQKNGNRRYGTRLPLPCTAAVATERNLSVCLPTKA